jgi:HAD superfamily hydrolase (TIGR01509 family)
MDGVLIDSEPLHEQSIIALSAELGDPITSKAVLDSFKGAPEMVMAGRLKEFYPASAGSPQQLILRKLDLYTELFPQVPVLPGVIDFLQRARSRGMRFALTTSANRATQELSFRTHELGPWFEAIVTGEDIARGKPDPEPYLLTAARLGLDPSDCVVIEDSLNGVLSGKAAGCAVIAITTTFPRAALEALGPDLVIDGFNELP